MKKILLIFTGGTVCSLPEGVDGKNVSDAKNTGCLLEENFRCSDSPFAKEISFDYSYLPQDILSENMTVGTWNIILDNFREKARDGYDGVIVLHGTDTLAYTASLLSLVLPGLDVPVILVSAQRDLHSPETNGYDNFRAAAELIAKGIAPNVYVVYRNTEDEGGMLLHYGNHLLQCPNFSDDFHSKDEIKLLRDSDVSSLSLPFETDFPCLDKIPHLCDNVLLLQPYTGLCYDRINLDGVCAVVHGTYHSESVCIGRAKNGEKDGMLSLCDIKEEDRPYSILSLIERCRERGIPVFLAPCSENFRYGTTANALFRGALPISDTTLETAYAKVLVGCSLGKRGEELYAFLAESINGEFVYRNKK